MKYVNSVEPATYKGIQIKMIMLLQPSPDGGGKLGFGVHGCFGGTDHNNVLLMITLGMGCNFLVGAGLLVKGRKRFAWIMNVKRQK